MLGELHPPWDALCGGDLGSGVEMLKGEENGPSAAPARAEAPRDGAAQPLGSRRTGLPDRKSVV